MDAVDTQVGIVHQVFRDLLGMVAVLVPKKEVKIVDLDPVDLDSGLFLAVFLLYICRTEIHQKLEIHVFFSFISDQVGFGIGQLYHVDVDVAMDDVFHDGLNP